MKNSWQLDLPKIPGFARQACRHEFHPHPTGIPVYDDVIEMNIQSGSQRDGFRHFGHIGSKRFYNNLTHEEVLSGTLQKAHN